MAYDLTNAKVFDVNGTKYQVGLDGHGYVQIQTGELDVETGEFVAYDSDTAIDPHIMLDPQTARAVVEHIEEIA